VEQTSSGRGELGGHAGLPNRSSGFDAHRPLIASQAQQDEHPSRKREVSGSRPEGGSWVASSRVEQLTVTARPLPASADMGALPSPYLISRFGVRVPGDPQSTHRGARRWIRVGLSAHRRVSCRCAEPTRVEDWPSLVRHPSRKRWSARERRAGSNPASSAAPTQVASSMAESSRLLLGGFGVRVPGDLRHLLWCNGNTARLLTGRSRFESWWESRGGRAGAQVILARSPWWVRHPRLPRKRV
jgi:hypothetical protein